MPRKVHQLLAGAEIGDAITYNAFELQRVLSAMNVPSFIYAPAQNIHSPVKNVFPLQDLGNNLEKGDTVYYHFSIGSPASEIYRGLSEVTKVIGYHNITPFSYFLPFSDPLASLLKEGREELKTLGAGTDAFTADSLYNAEELKALGFKDIEIIPLCLRKEMRSVKPVSPSFFEQGKTHLLFVGRVVPNKRIHALINMFSRYKTCNPFSRLVIAGSFEAVPAYYEWLRQGVKRLGLEEDIFFTGKMNEEALLGCYQGADAFVCLSGHEGFCLPLIEAMHFNLPVFALERAAVGETLGESGVVFDEDSPELMAELIHRVLTDKALKTRITENQKKRLEYFSHDSFCHRSEVFFKRVLNGVQANE